MSKMVITKEQIYAMRRKMTPEELEGYYKNMTKSAHIFQNKKKYNRKEKYLNKEE